MVAVAVTVRMRACANRHETVNKRGLILAEGKRPFRTRQRYRNTEISGWHSLRVQRQHLSASSTKRITAIMRQS